MSVYAPPWPLLKELAFDQVCSHFAPRGMAYLYFSMSHVISGAEFTSVVLVSMCQNLVDLTRRFYEPFSCHGSVEVLA